MVIPKNSTCRHMCKKLLLILPNNVAHFAGMNNNNFILENKENTTAEKYKTELNRKGVFAS